MEKYKIKVMGMKQINVIEKDWFGFLYIGISLDISELYLDICIEGYML